MNTVKRYLIINKNGDSKHCGIFETDEVARASKDFCPDEGDTIIETIGQKIEGAWKEYPPEVV